MEDTASLSSGWSEIWSLRASRELTIVIPADRCAVYLPVTVASALHSPAARVLIAYDSSDLTTLEAALSIEAAHPERVRVASSASQRGVARAVNEAAAKVETPYFVKLNGADVLLPGFIESAFPVIASRPRLAVIAGHELRVDPDEVSEFRPDLLPRARRITHLRAMAGAEAYRFILQWNPNPCPSGAIYRTEAFREVGGYDQQIPWGEDWEIWLRFAKAWEVAYTGTASALHRVQPQSAIASSTASNQNCHGYDAVYTRAAEVCDDPEVVPLIRRAFFGVAKHYVGAASREARSSRKASLVHCRLAWRALSRAMAL
jgi:hypothetical protein